MLGDVNFECQLDDAGYKQCIRVLSSYGMRHCDEFISDVHPITYVDDSQNHSSFICLYLIPFVHILLMLKSMIRVLILVTQTSYVNVASHIVCHASPHIQS